MPLIAHTEASTGSELSKSIKDESDTFPECGILVRCFPRSRCEACGHDKQLVFSRNRQAARVLHFMRRTWARHAWPSWMLTRTRRQRCRPQSSLAASTFGPRAGQKVLTLRAATSREGTARLLLCRADIDGFSLHAAAGQSGRVHHLEGLDGGAADQEMMRSRLPAISLKMSFAPQVPCIFSTTGDCRRRHHRRGQRRGAGNAGHDGTQEAATGGARRQRKQGPGSRLRSFVVLVCGSVEVAEAGGGANSPRVSPPGPFGIEMLRWYPASTAALRPA